MTTYTHICLLSDGTLLTDAEYTALQTGTPIEKDGRIIQPSAISPTDILYAQSVQSAFRPKNDPET